jgi:hypothetical protein
MSPEQACARPLNASRTVGVIADISLPVPHPYRARGLVLPVMRGPVRPPSRGATGGRGRRLRLRAGRVRRRRASCPRSMLASGLRDQQRARSCRASRSRSARGIAGSSVLASRRSTESAPSVMPASQPFPKARSLHVATRGGSLVLQPLNTGRVAVVALVVPAKAGAGGGRVDAVAGVRRMQDWPARWADLGGAEDQEKKA